jgi:hypothetical protein
VNGTPRDLVAGSAIVVDIDVHALDIAVMRVRSLNS